MPSQSKKPQFCVVPVGAITGADLKPRDIHVLCMLARNADRNGHTVRSQARMARELEWARSTVQTAVKNLINAGWLTRVESIRPDGGDCSHGYIILREKGLCSDRPDRLSTSGTVDTVKTALPAEPDRQGVPVQGGTYEINPSRPNNKKTDSKDTRDYLDIASPEPPIAASTKNGLAKDSYVHTADERDYIERVRSELLMFGLNPDAPHMVGGVNAVIAWYSCGADIDRDVLPTIEMVLSRAKTPPFSLAYFTKAIVNPAEARKAAERRVEEQTRKSEQKHTNPKSKFAVSVARVADTGATQSAEPIQTQPSRKKHPTIVGTASGQVVGGPGYKAQEASGSRVKISTKGTSNGAIESKRRGPFQALPAPRGSSRPQDAGRRHTPYFGLH